MDTAPDKYHTPRNTPTLYYFPYPHHFVCWVINYPTAWVAPPPPPPIRAQNRNISSSSSVSSTSSRCESPPQEQQQPPSNHTRDNQNHEQQQSLMSAQSGSDQQQQRQQRPQQGVFIRGADRRTLQNLRIIRRTLVYAIGLSPNFAQVNTLKQVRASRDTSGGPDGCGALVVGVCRP